MVLVLIALLGAFPRLWDLGRVPVSLHPDELASAADAGGGRPLAWSYSHERGGRVEGTYVWLAAPGVRAAQAWGWPSVEVAARLPAAFAGILLVAAVGWLGWELSRSRSLAWGAAVCAACMPWGWHFSRLALRGPLSALLVTLGLAAWLRAERGRGPRRWAAAGALGLAAGALTYPPTRLLALLLGLGLLWRARLAGPRRTTLVVAASLALGAAGALVPWTLWGGGSERLEQVALWDSGSPGASAYAVARGYLGHYGTRFLFSGSSSRGFAPEGVGLLPRWQAVLLVLGILACLGRRRRRDWFLMAVVLGFPLAAAWTRDVPNAMRAVLGIPALALMAGRGWEVCAGWWRRGRLAGRRLPGATVVILGVSTWAGWAAARESYDYFVRHPREQAVSSYPGRRELILRAREWHARGVSVRCEEPFLEAAWRLYGPDLPARRGAGEVWVFGTEPATRELRIEIGRWGEIGLRDRPL